MEEKRDTVNRRVIFIQSFINMHIRKKSCSVLFSHKKMRNFYWYATGEGEVLSITQSSQIGTKQISLEMKEFAIFTRYFPHSILITSASQYV